MKFMVGIIFLGILSQAQVALADCDHDSGYSLACATVLNHLNQKTLVTLQLESPNASCSRLAHIKVTANGVQTSKDLQVQESQPGDGGGTLLTNGAFEFRELSVTDKQVFGVLSLAQPLELHAYPIVCDVH